MVLGLVAGVLVSRWLIGHRPNIAVRLGLRAPYESLAEDDDGPPAVDPESIPITVNPTEEAKVASIAHPQLRRLLNALLKWKPKRHRDEDGFQRSFRTHLLKNGYTDEEVKRHERVNWTAYDRDATSKDKKAIPDYVVENIVLVEIKRNITGSSESDRSLGQMQRYSIAWRGRGPALLVVCNEYDDNLRKLTDQAVRGWKRQKKYGVPVMAYFARHPSVAEGDDEFPADSFSP